MSSLYQKYFPALLLSFSLLVAVGCGSSSGSSASGGDVPNPSAPVITIIGDNPLYVDINTSLDANYTDPGATALDLEDGNLTSSIVTVSDVNISAAGTYTVTYSVTDSNNSSAEATRTVIVTSVTVYEDAEDGSTARWYINDPVPAGATITNAYDNDIMSNVIVFDGNNTQNSYSLNTEMNNTTEKSIGWKWKMTNAGEHYIFEVKISTTSEVNATISTKTRFLRYTDNLEVLGYTVTGTSSNVFWYDMPNDTVDGTWHDFIRNVEEDLHVYEPDNNLTQITTIYIRGSLSIDDVNTTYP